MKILMVLLAALATVQCETVSVDRCSWGESYWCSQLKVAQQCGAVQHCMTTVWKNQQPKKTLDDSDVCQFCETIITDVRKFLEDEKDKEIIKQYLESACAIIPDPSLATECKAMVDDYLDVVLSLIASELDPATVCGLMGLCNNGTFRDTAIHPRPILTVPQKPNVNVNVEPLCTDCKKFFGDIKTFVTSETTEKELEELIEQNLCARMGSLADYCNQMVEAYVPEILDLVVNEFDPAEVCAAMGFCNSTRSSLLVRMRLQKSPLYNAAKKESSSEMCMLCQTVVSELQSLDKDPTIQAEVKTFLKNNLCKSLGSLEEACDSTIDQYLPDLFELLATELDPNSLCKALGFCSDDALANSLRQSMPSKPAGKKVPVTSHSSAQCVLCTFVVKELDGLLSQNATEQEIMTALDDVCDLLPGNLQSECLDFVKEYAPALIKILQQEMDPSVVCTFLGLCSSTVKETASPGCVVCELVIKQIVSMLSDNATEQEIEQALEAVCDLLPGSFKQECDDFVEQYGPMIIKLLLQEMDPDKVCAALGLCSSTVKETASPGCVVCELVIKQIVSMLSDNATEQEIEQALEAVCDLLPGSFKQECDDFVEQYGPMIIKLLLQEMDPDKVCAALGLCSSTRRPVLKKTGGDEMCGTCETLIQYLDSLLEENSTVQEIEKMLEKVCNFLPGDLKQECEDIVRLYGPAVIQLIAQFADPREVCTALGLCNNQTMKETVAMSLLQPSRPMLGGKKCTWGPSYWCKDKETAAACQAVEHCRKHVWND